MAVVAVDAGRGILVSLEESLSVHAPLIGSYERCAVKRLSGYCRILHMTADTEIRQHRLVVSQVQGLRFQVADTGIGIPPGSQETIFEKMFRNS